MEEMKNNPADNVLMLTTDHPSVTLDFVGLFAILDIDLSKGLEYVC
jgi:hypothetical protein